MSDAPEPATSADADRRGSISLDMEVAIPAGVSHQRLEAQGMGRSFHEPRKLGLSGGNGYSLVWLTSGAQYGIRAA